MLKIVMQRVVICEQLKVDDDIFVKLVERQLEAHLRETTYACMPINPASCLQSSSTASLG